ncbi:DUF6270 domain-containing protein [uncultured Piscinibacter sp.]|mgnify:CR=1 FL=1|uniref:DUF6270 domain-containing protein n=1 Tax=uncultured Piscinibacter sp. TaxID=1131835 RepID=UPI002610A6A9|nr:DUF6270 domain-containing protein [uncultured Piscinibacter sp.]
MKHRLAILGSCVSRDLFTHIPQALDAVELGPYVSRATLISMSGRPPARVVAKLAGHVAKRFDDRRFVLDARKDYFRVLAKDAPEVLVLDLIDERHATYLFDDGALTVTKVSKEFLTEHGLQRLPRIASPFSADWLRLQAHSLETLIDRLRADLPKTRFIVHAAPYAMRYLAEGEVRGFPDTAPILRWNEYLDAAYARLAQALDAPIIGPGAAGALAGGEHLWDLTPFHYDIGYYRTLWSSLAAQLDGRGAVAGLSA